MIRRPPRSTLDRSSAASDVYKRQLLEGLGATVELPAGQVLETDGERIAHLFQRRPHPFEFAQIHEVCRENSISKRGKFLSDALRFLRIRDGSQRFHKKSCPRQRLCENHRQVSGTLFSRYVLSGRPPLD